MFTTLVITQLGNCQCLTLNLIKNANLEEYTCCPNNVGMIGCAIDWTQPIVGVDGSTSEYLNTCGVDSLIMPSLLPFFQHVRFGNGYAGICNYAYNPNVSPPADYREYIQGTLSQPLKASQCYYCEFWVELFNYNNETSLSANDALGIFFSDTLPKRTDLDTMAMFYSAQISIATGRIITDTSNWEKISGYFIAMGGEKYFTVGNFKQINEINSIYFGMPYFDRSYYFFDNFSLCPCEDTIPPAELEPVVFIPKIFSPNSDGQNDVFRVRSENIVTLHLTVYNRWGEKVFESQNPSEGWDGNYKGLPCSADVYVYHATIIFEDGTETSRKGNVTLMR